MGSWHCGWNVLALVGLVCVRMAITQVNTTINNQTANTNSTKTRGILRTNSALCSEQFRECNVKHQQCQAEARKGANSTSTRAQTKVTHKAANLRLPSSFYPEHYNLELQPYMNEPDSKNMTFKGSVKIWIRCVLPSNNVTLQVKNLTIIRSSVRFFGDFPNYTTPTYQSFEEQRRRNFLILKLKGNTEVDKTYIVMMNYTAPLENGLVGFHITSYKNGNQTV
ncbi:hypothetical protein Btru_070995 [Bulinus truncatus]|nr:hypothetical protein Btru_070995 [Bulinus truncatus]